MTICLVLNNIIPILTANDVAKDHKWTYQQRGMNFDKNLNLKGQYCYHPFNTITVDGHGDIYMCVCQAWLPISVGNILDFNQFEDIISSVKAKQIQSSILDGSYRYCDNNTCGIIQENKLKNNFDQCSPTITWINFALDPSCNLTCPSCRNNFVFLKRGREFNKRIQITKHLIKLIEQHNQALTLTLSGDGDPFASLIYRYLLSNLTVKFRPVEIEIVTNGILAKAHWRKMVGIHRNVVRFKISFDAGSEAIYNITRRGGDWHKLIDSTKYIRKWKQDNKSRMVLTANFVVQQANYKDMINYVELCTELGFDEINFQKIVDWGTFENFVQEAVWENTHPEFAEFLKYLHHPSLNNSKVNLTNLTDIKNETK